MNKELKMELLNSEKQKQVQGGIIWDCPPAAQFHSDKPGGCNAAQNNVITCNNYEVSKCGERTYIRPLDNVKQHLVY